ncbi:MAG: hypothetical protein ACRENC_18585, partial [Gemmatimonadaceae bacterium]
MTPNTQLRAAREATWSPRLPGAHLSRQELADAVNAWCFENHQPAALDAHYIGRLEQGRIRRPRRAYRAGFRAVLGRTDIELGWGDDTAHGGYPRKGGDEEDDAMERRAFLTAASAALFAAPVIAGEYPIPTPETPLPSRVGAGDVAALRETIAHLRTVSRMHGDDGGLLAPTLARAERLLDVPAAEPVRRSLLAATGDLHNIAGWDAFDVGQDSACRAHLGRCMELCSAGGDVYGASGAAVLAGVQADERGHLADARQLLDLARGKLATLPDDDDPRAYLK